MKKTTLMAILLLTSSVQAQTLDLTDQNDPRWHQAIAASRVETGMPADLAIDLLGRKPDEQILIGAACGMLDVMTWQQDGKQTKIITTDGFVSSISVSEVLTEAR